MTRLIPRQPVPALSVPTLDDGEWTLTKQQPERFNLIVFYRGLHCPICRGYIRDLDRRSTEFRKRGVEVIAISSDVEERARQAKEQWQVSDLLIGYGLSIASAREWGLYVSTSRGMTSAVIEEPALFNEPGLFLVRADGTLYAGVVQTMPFTRPNFEELLRALDFIIPNDYPARGEA